jgi:hypothetical protein
LWNELTDAAGVPRIPNGLRHSAISYSLTANAEHGRALTATWAGNSEATISKHYRRLIKQAEAAKWFQVQTLKELLDYWQAEYRKTMPSKF